MTADVSSIRSIVAVGAGFFTTAVLSLCGDLALRAVIPQAFDSEGHATTSGALFAMLAYSVVFTGVAGYIAARLAIRRPVTHAMIVGVITLAFAVASVVVAWNNAPSWYHLSSLALILPAAFIGGKIRERQQ